MPSFLRRLPAMLAALGAAVMVSGCNIDLPAELKGPVAGAQLECKEAGQQEPDPAAFVSTTEIDGDGKPDYAVDYGKTCKASRDLYCNKDGCSVDFYVSSGDLIKGGSFKSIAWKATTQDGKAALQIIQPGQSCGKEWQDTCLTTYSWREGDFHAVP